MDARTLLDSLFPAGHDVTFDGAFFSGCGRSGTTDLAVIGVCLVIIVLVAGWFSGREGPEGKYIPPSVVDGKVVPGHFEETGQSQ